MYQNLNEPLVSIVIPIYNVEDFLEECLTSVVSQTYKNIEIILIDDGSTDRSGDIAEKFGYKDKRITIVHQKNGGLSFARNAAIKIASGEYITFVDSDDLIDKSFVEILLSYAIKNTADIVQCNNSREHSHLGSGSNKALAMSGQYAFIKLLNYKEVSPTAWGKLYKLSIFKDNTIEFPVGRLHEDTATLYKLIYSSNTIVCIEKILYFYRLNSASIMNSNYTKRHYSSVIKYLEELDDFVKENNIEINESVLSRHKALRLLSVLNKLANHDNYDRDIYSVISKEYVNLSFKSHDIFCIAGCVPVIWMPGLFRTIKKGAPTLRRIVGKV